MIWTSVIFWQKIRKVFDLKSKKWNVLLEKRKKFGQISQFKIYEIAQISIIGIIQDKSYIISKYFHGIDVFLR